MGSRIGHRIDYNGVGFGTYPAKVEPSSPPPGGGGCFRGFYSSRSKPYVNVENLYQSVVLATFIGFIRVKTSCCVVKCTTGHILQVLAQAIDK